MLDLQKNHHLPILYTSFYTFPSLSLSLSSQVQTVRHKPPQHEGRLTLTLFLSFSLSASLRQDILFPSFQLKFFLTFGPLLPCRHAQPLYLLVLKLTLTHSLSLSLYRSLMWSTCYMVHSLSFSLSISQACAHTHTQEPVRSRISRSLFFCVALEAAATTTPMATTATPMATTGNSRSSTIGFSMHLGAVCCLQNVFIYQKHFLSTAATTYAS